MGTLLRKSKVKPITPASPFPAEKLARRRRRLAKKSMEGDDLLHVELFKDEEPASPFSADKLAWKLLRSLAKKPTKGLGLVLRKLSKGSPPIVRQLYKDGDEGSPPIIRQLFKDDQEENQGAAEANKVENLQLSTNEEENNQGAAERREHQELQDRINKKLLFQEHVKSLQTIIEEIRAYIKSYRETASFKSTRVKKNDKILQVVDMNSEQVLSKIVKLKAFARSNNTIPVPSRADENQDYNLILNRNVLLKEDPSTQKQTKNERKFELLDHLLTVIYELCLKEKTMEIRTIYYRDPNLYRSREKVSAAIDDLCCVIGCTRSSLHVYASEKGVVFGNISFSVGRQRYRCTTGGIKGTPIPSKTNLIHSMKNKDALFILVVEKETVFERLVEDGFCKEYHCILITAKGMPDVASRYFLRKMRNTFKLPVFALVDFDPYGLKIFSVFRNGSKNMSFDSENLSTPDIKLLGMLHTDIEKYGIPEHLKLKMTDFDIKTATSLLKKTYFSKEERDELNYMLNNGIKCEVEAWTIHGIEYLSKVLLPLKIRDEVRPKFLIDNVSK